MKKTTFDEMMSRMKKESGHVNAHRMKNIVYNVHVYGGFLSNIHNLMAGCSLFPTVEDGMPSQLQNSEQRVLWQGWQTSSC